MASKVTAIIPARLGSRRFPGKVLYPYLQKPLLFYVWNDLRRCKGIDRLVIATDNFEIEKTARGFGAEVIRTSASHKTGSDRAAEVVEKVGGSIIVNVQADNFGIKAAWLNRIIALFSEDKKAAFGTIAAPIISDAELFNPNQVKVVADKSGNALWFSRFPIPYLQGADGKKRFAEHKFLGHVGIYFYRRPALKAYHSWGQSALEKAESLEQLRILENGGKIRLYRIKSAPVAVDSPDDLIRLDKIYK